MKCSNTTCPSPKKEHLFLFAGKLCAECKHLYVEPVEQRLPAGRNSVPKDMTLTAVRTGKHRDRQYAQQMRIRYIIERDDGTYRQWKASGKSWGGLSTAKTYDSLSKANWAVKLIGEGVAVRI